LLFQYLTLEKHKRFLVNKIFKKCLDSKFLKLKNVQILFFQNLNIFIYEPNLNLNI
jgi:hypothetical protein